MIRAKPPPHHTAKLRELVARQIRALPLPEGLPPAAHYAVLQLRGYLQHVWQPDQPLPHGSVSLYLRLRGIPGKTALVALSAALRGARCCPPGARYAPVGWREFIEEEAAKAAKEQE